MGAVKRKDKRAKSKEQRAKRKVAIKARAEREFTLYAEPKQLKDREAGLKIKDKNY